MDQDIRYAFGELGEALAYPEKRRDWEDAFLETNPEIYALFEDGLRAAASEAGHGEIHQEIIAIKDFLTLVYAPIFFRLGQKEFPTLSMKMYENFIERYDRSGSFIALVRALDTTKQGWGDLFNYLWNNYKFNGMPQGAQWHGLTQAGEKVVLTMGHGLIAQAVKFIADDMSEHERFADERYSFDAANNSELEDEYAAQTEGALAFQPFRVPKRRRASLGTGTGKLLQFRHPSQ